MRGGGERQGYTLPQTLNPRCILFGQRFLTVSLLTCPPERYIRGAPHSLHSSRINQDPSHAAAINDQISAAVCSSLPSDDPNGDVGDRRGDHAEGEEGSGRPSDAISHLALKRQAAQSGVGTDQHQTGSRKRRVEEGGDVGLSFDSAWDDDNEADTDDEEEDEEEEEGFNEGTEEVEAQVTADRDEHLELPRGQNVQSKHVARPTASLTQCRSAAASPGVLSDAQIKKPVSFAAPVGGIKPAPAAPRPAAVAARKASSAPPFDAMNDLEAAWAMSVDDEDDDDDMEEEEDNVDAGRSEDNLRSEAPPGSLATTAAVPPAPREAQAATQLPAAAPRADNGHVDAVARPVPDFGDEDWKGNGSDEDVGDANLCSDDNSGGGIEYF